MRRVLRIKRRKSKAKLHARLGGAIGIFLLIAVVASLVRQAVPKFTSAIAHLPVAYRILGTNTKSAGNVELQEQVASALIAAGGTLPGGQTPASVPKKVQVIPGATQTAVQTTAPSPQVTGSVYPSHTVVASVFWLGEAPSADNSYITNTETEWDPQPVAHFGGYDDPNNRTSTGLPAAFSPLHNPYYFALPVSEYDNNGNLLTQSRSLSPWASQSVAANRSLLKGRWIRVQKGSKVIYAQWVDTGPYETNDYKYVYGTAAPSNTVGLKAGLDLSPAAAHALGIDGAGTVTWRFADAGEAAAASGLWNNFAPINNINYWD